MPGSHTVESHAVHADVTNGRPPGTALEQAYKHRARDALDLADLRLARRSSRSEGATHGLRHASMSRGVEARGSIGTPGVPRALGSSERSGGKE